MNAIKPARRHYGEEAQKLTNREQLAHNTRTAQMRAGTYDFSDTLVEAPRAVNAEVLSCAS